MDELSLKFSELFGTDAKPRRFFCPGRVNLIGEHIDYLGGSVLPAAISLGITAYVATNDSSIITIHSIEFNESVSLNLDSLPNKKQDHWSDFLLGVVLNLLQDGITIRGCDLLIDSNLPKGAGLSSSAALEVLLYHALRVININTEPDRIEMALKCKRIENEFIGVNCGIMDQFAVANGKRENAILLNCNTLDYKFIPLKLGDNSLVIVNSNKPRALAQSAYNTRREECSLALEKIRMSRYIGNLVDAMAQDLKLLSTETLKKRTAHAFSEQLRVNDSIAALGQNNLAHFGKLMIESHRSLRDDYKVSCVELDFIVDTMIGLEGCLGARMTGAGFGGSCIGLVATENLESLKEKLHETYTKRFGFTPSIYTCIPSDGVHELT